MHDPMVVAFEIRRPWPKRVNWTGTRWYWPSIITVWHREPGGHDAGEVCKHYIRTPLGDGQWTTKHLHGWKWHVHHWRLQVKPFQDLRRWALTRCAWCNGRHTKLDPVNNSTSWDGPRGKWWQGEPGLYHRHCVAFSHAHTACLCEAPIFDSDGYGHCARCGKFRAWGRTEQWVTAHRILAAQPVGDRDLWAYTRYLEAIKSASPDTQEATLDA